MKGRCYILAAGLFLLLGCLSGPAAAQDNGLWHPDRNRIYGEDLMTAEERQEYRQQIWHLRTEADRDHFRDRHRQKMQERAWNTGATLPEESEGSEKGETQEQKWPADGLRRWPETRGRAEGVRRWPTEPSPVPVEQKQDWTERVKEERNGRRNLEASGQEEAAGDEGWRTGDRSNPRQPGRLPPTAVRPGAGAVATEAEPPDPKEEEFGLKRIR